jgi:hypothetical protein
MGRRECIGVTVRGDGDGDEVREGGERGMRSAYRFSPYSAAIFLFTSLMVSFTGPPGKARGTREHSMNFGLRR